jgi:hypothetical protein
MDVLTSTGNVKGVNITFDFLLQRAESPWPEIIRYITAENE